MRYNMTSSNFNLRGIDPEVMRLLKRESQEQHISVNMLIIKLVEQGIGYRCKGKRVKHHELDNLAGTWSEEDSQRFDENIK
jgi:hypothetical protein